MANRRRGASFQRRATRAGFQNLELDSKGIPTGRIKKRPFSNKSPRKGKRKPSFHIQTVQPMMTVDMVDVETGESYEVRVPKTETREVERRVFPDNNGNYPEGSYTKEVWHSGNPNKGSTKTRTYHFLKVVEEFVVPSFQRRHKL